MGRLLMSFYLISGFKRKFATSFFNEENEANIKFLGGQKQPLHVLEDIALVKF